MGRRKKTVHGEKKLPSLPWELIEEILSRVPPQSLGGFKIVSKKWNTLFDDKTFLNNHKSTFRFVLRTTSKLYSVSIDPEVVVRELTLDIPDFKSQTPERLVDCGEFLLCCMGYEGSAVWNPWLKQAREIKTESNLRIEHGIGYESNREVKESGYKTIGSHSDVYNYDVPWKIHDFATGAWEELKMGYVDSSESTRATLYTRNGVSCNGNLYWVAYYNKTDPLYHVREFEFLSQSFCHFCDLPCLKNHEDDALVLGGFNGDQLSLLKQCHKTRKIEIWVTKNKINSDDDDVVWTNFMEVSIPNLPDLRSDSTQPSYFIDDKRIVVCCCSETGRAWIYIMGENKLISKTKINSMVDHWPLHCTYFPTLVPVPVPVPRGKKKNRRGKRKNHN